MALELRLIRHALAVGRYGNFARAAEALHLTQPSLSRSIAALEATLGVTLFDRGAKGVTPTPFGRVLLQRGAEMVEREAALRREIGQLAGLEAGTLVIAAGPYPAETSVAQAVAQVAAAHPRLRIECRAMDALQVVQEVLTERADVGISTVQGLEHEQRLQVEALPPQRVWLACRPGHPLTREAAPTLQQALQFPLVTTLLRSQQARVAANRGGAARDGDGDDGDEGDEGDYVPQILVNSVAIAKVVARGSDALLPGLAATLADEVAAARLVLLDIDGPQLRSNYGLFHLRERLLPPAARAFIAAWRGIEAAAAAAGEALAQPAAAAKG